MKLRVWVLFAMAVTVGLTACGREEPPQEPTPVLPDTAGDGARRAREDSIARENARLAAERAAAEEATRRARSILEERVHFDYDASAIRADAQTILQQKVNVMRANPNVALRIVGHADERGSVEYNLALGMRRAAAVRDFMVGFGLDASRFAIETMGEDQPLVQGSNESAWAQNRRGEFVITRGGDNLVMPGQ